MSDDERFPTILQLSAAVVRARSRVWRPVLLVVLVTVLAKQLVPRTYTSEAALIPRMPTSTSGVAGIAAQFGVNIGGGEALQLPDFYADALRSRPVLEPFLSRKLPADLRASQDTTVLAVLTRGDPQNDADLNYGVATMANRLVVRIERRTGVLYVGLPAKSAELAQWMLRALLEDLDVFNTRLRASQARAERHFSEAQETDARRRLTEAEDKVVAFDSANVAQQTSSRLVYLRQRLQREADLRQTVYTSVVQEAEKARLDERRDTPIVGRVQEPSRPLTGDPRGTVVLAGFMGLLAFLTLSAMAIARVDFGVEPNRHEDVAHDLQAALRKIRAFLQTLRW